MENNHGMDFSSAPQAYRPAFQNDTAELRRYLEDTLETWLPRLMPGGRIQRKHFVVGSVMGEEGSSLKVNLDGEKRGLWIDHCTGEKGDVFALLSAALGVGFVEAKQTARSMRGIAMPQREAPLKSPSQHHKEDTHHILRRIVGGCFANSRPRVDAYLSARGISIDVTKDILEHPSLWHAPSQSVMPAMVSKIRNIEGEIIGLHRTYLDPHAPKKADIDQNKMMIGSAVGGAVRLSNITHDHLGICEGIETGLAAMQLYDIPTWAALSTSGMRTIALPESITTVTIFADNDAPIDRPGTPLHGKSPGLMAAAELGDRLTKEGRMVEIRIPPDGLKDFNDLLHSGISIKKKIGDSMKRNHACNEEDDEFMSSGCVGKFPFDTMAKARLAAKKSSGRRDYRAKAYKCAFCQQFHIGSTINASRTKRERIEMVRELEASGEIIDSEAIFNPSPRINRKTHG